MQKKTLKSEQGSITLFVLLAILFFLIVIFSVFMTSSNKNRIQLEELDKIKQEYEKDLENIDEIYEDITRDSIFIVFRTPDGKLHPESRWTNQDLTVKIYYPEGTAEENKLVKIDNGEFTNYTGEFTINKSTKITAMIRNGKEKEANAKIDKTPPTYTTNPSVPNFPIPANSSVADINISVNASDAESGLKKLEYAYVEDTSTPTSYTELSNDEVLTFKSKPQGVYYLWLRIEDNVGNITNERVEMNVVDYVAKIGDTYYVTLQEAIDACPEGTLTQIDIIKPIEFKPNAVVPNGKNVTINLNGYSITGPGTIIENNGTLTIIDTNTANTGKITSTDGTVIQNNGTFTLGANDGIVNQTSPVLTGENMVINTSGTFNFYDGVLIGDKAIEGTINSQPDEYSVISKKEGDKERVYLGVLAESAAKIDKWFYNTLDEAIADCPENAGEEKTTITILRDLSLTTKATIDNGKNVIIDLNGHSITNTISDYVIENSSTLEILDSTETKAGSINGVNYSTVLNNRGANLTVSSGTISLSKQGASSNYYSSVKNEGEFLLKDSGNIQTTQSSYTYAVYNNGSMTTSGGNINALGMALYNTTDSYISEDGMDYEEISIDNIVSNGTYYFEKDENGSLVSNNTGIKSSTANSYIEIDLENETGNFVVEVNAEISSENSDYGYAILTQSTTAPVYYGSGRFMYISGTTEAQNYTKDLEGGKKYYLHFGYRKDSSVNRGNDILTIHSIKIGKYAQTPGQMEINNTTIQGTTGVYNNSTTINIKNTIITSDEYGIYNNTESLTNIVNTNIESSKYGIYTKGTINIGENDGNILNNFKITGATNAVYNEGGILNFYDGILKGTEISNGYINSVADNSDVEYSTEDDMKTLQLVPFKGPVAQIGNTTYNTLQEAFNAVEDNKEEQTIVTVLRDIVILNEENTPIIGESKNIYLNINQKHITLESSVGIKNYGKLEIGNLNEISNPTSADLVANGTYYFLENENGTLISNNIEASTTEYANSYIPIDLTQFTGTYKLELNAAITGSGTGYAIISESSDVPTSSNFVYLRTSTGFKNYSTELEGGKIYYLHLRYKKSTKDSQVEFKVRDIKIYSTGSIDTTNDTCITNEGSLTISKGITITTSKDDENAILNTGVFVMNEGKLSASGLHATSNTAALYNESGTVNINGGILVSGVEKSSSDSYAIYNNSTEEVIINNATILSVILSTNSTSYSWTTLYGVYNSSNTANVTVNNSTIMSYPESGACEHAYGIYNYGSGTIDVNGISIFVSTPGFSSRCYGIYNYANGIINYDMSEIEATGTATYNRDIGKINIIGGSAGNIYNNGNGIITITGGTTEEITNASTGTITLGENDGNVSQTIPEVNGNLENVSGIFNFYDGQIIASTPITGEISDVATGCDVIILNENSVTKAILDNSPVAQIGENTYNSLQEAFDAVEDNKENATEITLLRNTSVLNEDARPIVSATKNIYLNLNGYTISEGNASGIENYGTLEVGDKVSSTGIINSSNGNGITNYGNLSLSDGATIKASDISIYNEGTLNINGGTVLQSGLYNDKYAIFNSKSGVVNVNSGNITSYNHGIYNNENGKIILNGGTITGKSYSSKSAIYNNSSGKIEINGGEIITFAYGVYNNASGRVTMTSGAIKAQDPNEYTHGIHNNSTGTIIIGIDDNTVSTSTPEITAFAVNSRESIGVYNPLGTLNFYDGKITGSSAITGTITNVPEGYDIIKEATKIVDEYYNNDPIIDVEIATLGKQAVAQIDSTQYTTLQEAFDAVEDNKNEPTTVTLLRDMIIFSEENRPIIRETKNIFLDLNGYMISGTNESGIESNGTLEISNNEEEKIIDASELVQNGTYYFENDGTGSFISNNTGIESSTANSYIKLDLTAGKGKTYIITVNAEISSNGQNYGNYATGYATITEDETAPRYSNTEGRFMRIYGNVDAKDYTTELIGGRIYYLHLGYYKYRNSENDGLDRLKFNKITLSTNGTISTNGNRAITNNGKLVIGNNITIVSDMSETGTILNNAELIINAGNIEITSNSCDTHTTTIYNNNPGKITINGGYISSTSTQSGGYNKTRGIYSLSTESITMNGGEIYTTESGNVGSPSLYGIYAENECEINLNGGTISSKGDKPYGIYNNSNGKVNVTGGNILMTSIDSGSISYGIYNNSNGEINIDGGNIQGTTSALSSTSRQASTAYAIFNNDNGKININQGDIIAYSKSSSSSSSSNAYGIYNRNGEVNIHNGKIQASTSDSTISKSYGVYNNTAGITNIYGGIITSSSYEPYGIQNAGILTLGVNDNLVNINSPEIISTDTGSNSYGVSNTGTFNFYDGKISAGTATIYGNVTEVAPGYEIKKTTADGISTDILALSATDNTVCVLNSINYSSLQDALDACTGTENYTISLTNACRLAEPITIPKGKNITLSINGFDIYYDGSDSMIINNGTLTIKDTNTVSSGNLSNTIGSVIENNGTLIIGDNDGNVTSRSPHITGTDTAITNNGTIEFYDGTITGIKPISGNEIKTIPEDYNLVETTEDNVKTLSLVGITPEVTYKTESVSGGTKITVTATDTNLSMIINPDDSEVTGSDTEIVSEYIVTSSGVYTFKAIDKNNNVTTIDVAV